MVVAAIERLKPVEELAGTNEALQYRILSEEYLSQLSNTQIQMRHSISESTLYRHRRAAIAALAQELYGQEHALARRQTAASRSRS